MLAGLSSKVLAKISKAIANSGNTVRQSPLIFQTAKTTWKSFWHVLVWGALKNCDHQFASQLPKDVVNLLGHGFLFNRKHIDSIGQKRSRVVLTSITGMKLGSKKFFTIILVKKKKTAKKKVLATSILVST